MYEDQNTYAKALVFTCFARLFLTVETGSFPDRYPFKNGNPSNAGYFSDISTTLNQYYPNTVSYRITRYPINSATEKSKRYIVK